MKLSIFPKILLSPLLVLFAIGCASVAQRAIKEPKVALSSVKIQDVGSSGATVVFGVEVDNPNAFALKVDSVRYDVEIAGKPLSSGKIDKPTEVLANAKSVVEIPVPVKFSDLYNSVLDFMSNQTSQYRIRGDARVGVLTLPFDETGELKLKK